MSVDIDPSYEPIFPSAPHTYRHRILPSSDHYKPLVHCACLFCQQVPLNLYAANTFLAEYKLNRVDGTFDLGYAFDRFSELDLAMMWAT